MTSYALKVGQVMYNEHGKAIATLGDDFVTCTPIESKHPHQVAEEAFAATMEMYALNQCTPMQRKYFWGVFHAGVDCGQKLHAYRDK